MASPSAFLNIESSNFNEEGHKNSNTNLMGTNKEKIYDLENETEVLFEEIKEWEDLKPQNLFWYILNEDFVVFKIFKSINNKEIPAKTKKITN